VPDQAGPSSVTSSITIRNDAGHEIVVDISLPSAGPQTLEDRLARIRELMAESSRLSNQVSAELEARAATAKKLQEEAEQAEALATVNREQAEAVRRLLEADIAETLADSGKATSGTCVVTQSGIGIASFVAGGGVTLLVTPLVHPLG
jgi:multidrug efflux pump subunit AcrA (membrane-fusion protein)